MTRVKIGDMVHYVSGGRPGIEPEQKVRAAIVTDVHRHESKYESEEHVDLTVLSPGLTYPVYKVKFHETYAPGRWSWPSA